MFVAENTVSFRDSRTATTYHTIPHHSQPQPTTIVWMQNILATHLQTCWIRIINEWTGAKTTGCSNKTMLRGQADNTKVFERPRRMFVRLSFNGPRPSTKFKKYFDLNLATKFEESEISTGRNSSWLPDLRGAPVLRPARPHG